MSSKCKRDSGIAGYLKRRGARGLKKGQAMIDPMAYGQAAMRSLVSSSPSAVGLFSAWCWVLGAVAAAKFVHISMPCNPNKARFAPMARWPLAVAAAFMFMLPWFLGQSI